MTETQRPRMSALDTYAHHASCSYGSITPERFAEIIKGNAPRDGEEARICQGLLETAPDPINRTLADELASELGTTRAVLEQRCRELCGEELGSSSVFYRHLPPTLVPDYWRSASEVSHWDCRVMKRQTEDGPDKLAVYEVFYGYEGDVITWAARPFMAEADANADSDLDLRAELKFMEQALGMPVLDFETGKEIAPPLTSDAEKSNGSISVTIRE